ncbi:MAG: response regulator transcription factor [Deltaproteobacteria bacterium]|nr:response regulator transcription factor [Deltaproteobacteria bacterium]
MKKILFVDDHAIVRQGVIKILQEIMAMPVLFDEASDSLQALKMADSGDYDLVLLDISLPDQNGLIVLKQIVQLHPKLPVIMLSSHPEDHYAVRTLRAGAAGYVNKGCDAVVLKEAVEKVLAGKKYVSPTQAELLVDAICDSREIASPHETLSDREYQLACMMTAGKTLTEIAGELSLSVKTVSTYRSRVLEKLQLRTTADIINYCIQNKFSL